jgi:hypothetical protein
MTDDKYGQIRPDQIREVNGHGNDDIEFIIQMYRS